MSTVAFTRSSKAPTHCAIVLPIDMPSVPRREASTSGPGRQPVEGTQAVVDHHSPQHTALPEHSFHGIELGRLWLRAPKHQWSIDKATNPGGGQRLGIGRGLKVGAPFYELALADRRSRRRGSD